jgi:hypothetical protein
MTHRPIQLSGRREIAGAAVLDLLVRIARLSVQIKKLVQELAIQFLRLDWLALFEVPISMRDAAVIGPHAPHSSGTASRLSASASQILFLCWLVCLVALNGMLLNEPLSRWLVYTIAPLKSNTIEVTLKPLLTAAYKN